MAGPIRPDAVTRLRLEIVDSELVVKWEWSENSFDLASPGALFERPITVKDDRLAWAGLCKSQKRQRLKRVVPPPVEPLTEAEAVYVLNLTHHVQGESLIIRHGPSGSTAEYEGPAEDNRYQNVTFTQDGAYVRLEFLMRCSENGDKSVRNVTRFLKLKDGRLSWA